MTPWQFHEPVKWGGALGVVSAAKVPEDGFLYFQAE
jgi:hypothetical protein